MDVRSWLKVVSAKEMADIEKKAVEEGFDPSFFMKRAGENIAKFILAKFSNKKILLLLGKGNNAGDALVCGKLLLDMGYEVRAFQFLDRDKKGSFLFDKNLEVFEKVGGKTFQIENECDIEINSEEIIVDGIFGTGFKGGIKEELACYIKKINELKNIKVSIDIPSGVNGDTGEVLSTALKADYTIFLQLPKLGFFLNRGWNFVGSLEKAEFGLEQKYVDEVNSVFYLVEDEKIVSFLPKIERIRHKYQAGFVAAIAGSIGMEGAANLSGKAALRSGAGIVKLFIQGYEESKNQDMADELVKKKLDFSKEGDVLAVCEKALAVFVGPGIGRCDEKNNFLTSFLPKIKKFNVVLDADALYFLSNVENIKSFLSEKCIITPHRKEMLRLLHKNELSDLDLIEETKKFAEENNVVVVLKGAPTFVVSPEGNVFVIAKGDPGMATAGTGDVLTGVITALLAQGVDLLKAAILGVFLHGTAGEFASQEKTSYSMIASDVIECLPKAFKFIENCSDFYTKQ